MKIKIVVHEAEEGSAAAPSEARRNFRRRPLTPYFLRSRRNPQFPAFSPNDRGLLDPHCAKFPAASSAASAPYESASPPDRPAAAESARRRLQTGRARSD